MMEDYIYRDPSQPNLLPSVAENETLNVAEGRDSTFHLQEALLSVTLSTKERKESSYSDDLSCYRLPKRTESHDELTQKFTQMFNVSPGQLRRIANSFCDELDKGLVAHKAHPDVWVEEECSFKMLDSCIDKLPTGEERGVYYALDFGGTNLRAVRVHLGGSGVVTRSQERCSLKYDGPVGTHKGLLDGSATATMLFDHFATRVKSVMDKSGDAPTESNPIGVGFTFSFPCEQKTLTSAKLVRWTKGFDTGRLTNDPVENEDVGRLLNEAFKRNTVNAKLCAIVNDTVGTLISSAYNRKEGSAPFLVGVILGTGMNGAYVEDRASQFGYIGSIINVECGNFNRSLPVTEIDLEVDWHTLNRGSQLLEKQISGAYLGEIMRLTLIRVFRNRAPFKAWTAETFTTEDGSVVINDNSADLSAAYEQVQKKWNANLTVVDLVDLQRICRAVFDRSSALAAAAICALAKQTGYLYEEGPGVCVSIDGSLYVKNTWYRERVRHHMGLILGKGLSSRIILVPANDGSGQGAAILASLYHK